MGSRIHQPVAQAGSLDARYDRLAALLAAHDPERLQAFWEALPAMGKKRARKRMKRPAGDTLAGVIAARIKALGLTVYRVGKMAGVSPIVIGRFLHGERDITLGTAEKLCRALDLVLVPRPGDVLEHDLARERGEE
jgi:hypothetical protein